MDGVLALGGPVPLGVRGGGGWDWWPLLGFATLLAFLLTSRRSMPLPLAIGLSAVGGLILADLTHIWGVTPVWGVVLIIALSRNVRRSGRRHEA